MKFKKPSKLLLNRMGLFLVLFSTIVTKSACLGFIGEPDVPKSLLE
ncbi:cyclic lactone autoinducer peptide [Clostridium sp. A1-XYC3]|uniref:Cyclic lactone autoinducer peptide n=1 Tax=Clostridium tanneri TaxID=3037988 RepID=A0ABU4JRW0_9CLOT|nr:cyclic lactone autoinducer peptide [Clostridium sp. A1-XYC3]MDW8800706.1 cyclic lactone autoinducer peptide [Clostridium sp. A1-XYC3]